MNSKSEIKIEPQKQHERYGSSVLGNISIYSENLPGTFCSSWWNSGGRRVWRASAPMRYPQLEGQRLQRLRICPNFRNGNSDATAKFSSSHLLPVFHTSKTPWQEKMRSSERPPENVAADAAKATGSLPVSTSPLPSDRFGLLG